MINRLLKYFIAIIIIIFVFWTRFLRDRHTPSEIHVFNNIIFDYLKIIFKSFLNILFIRLHRSRVPITVVIHSIRMSRVTPVFPNLFYELISIYLIFLVTGVPKSEPKDIRIERNTTVIAVCI